VNSDTISLPSINWRSGHPLRYESLWSVTHKLCWLNSIRAPSLLKHFGKNEAAIANFKKTWGVSRACLHDLRFTGALDGLSLSRAIRAPGVWMDWSCFDQIGDRQSVRRWTVPFLRFCPVCLEQGFHSILFQNVGQRECPVHRALLEDGCPKCGQYIPYSLPSSKTQPYSCECRRALWWGIRAENWDLPDAHIDKAGSLDKTIRALIEQWPPQPRSASNGAFAWVRHRSPQETHWLRQIDTIRGGGINAPKPVVVSRKWGFEFVSSPHFARPQDSVYGVVPINDSTLREGIFETYRRIERSIYRRFPVSNRKRWLAMTNRLRCFKDIGVMNWSPQFLAYLIWKSYWLDTCWGAFPRGHKMEKESVSHYRPQLSKVYWRYLQHARLLRPSGRFTTADEWAHLHFFSIVAMATYRAALELVGSVQLRCYPFRANRCRRLEKAILPVVMLAQNSVDSETYELRVWGRGARK